MALDLAVIEKYAGVLECVDQRLVVVVEVPLAPIWRIEIHVHQQRFAIALVQAIAQHVFLHIRTVLVALLADTLHHPGVLAQPNMQAFEAMISDLLFNQGACRRHPVLHEIAVDRWRPG